MYIAYQFPIIDFRCFFLNVQRVKLEVPSFPIPTQNGEGAEMLRNFGDVKNVEDGNVAYFRGNNQYVRADRVIRFPSMPRFSRVNGIEVESLCKFRGFFSDGHLQNKFEVGILSLPLRSPDSIIPVIHRYYKQKVRVRGVCLQADDQYKLSYYDCNFKNAGSKVAALYLYSSCKKAERKSLLKGWVDSVPPLCFVKLTSNEDYSVDSLSESPLIEITGFNRYGFSLYYCHRELPIWFCKQTKNEPDFQFMNQLRKSLYGFHVDRECIKRVIKFTKKAVASNDSVVDYGKVYQYLRSTQRRIERYGKSGCKVDQVVSYAFEVDALINKGEYEQLLNELTTLADKLDTGEVIAERKVLNKKDIKTLDELQHPMKGIIKRLACAFHEVLQRTNINIEIKLSPFTRLGK